MKATTRLKPFVSDETEYRKGGRSDPVALLLCVAIGQEAAMQATTDGQLLTEALWKRADHGGGWVEYESCDADTLQATVRMVYTVKAGDDLLVACSMVRETA